MKKILIILVLLVTLLTSCELSADKETLQQFSAETFHEVEYKGHSYIMFKYAIGNAGYAGLTHNPDCQCKKGEQNE